MALHNGSGELLENIQNLPEEVKAAMELMGTGEHLIPVQLPEGPARSLESSVEGSALPKSPAATESIDSISQTRLRKSHPGSPLDVFRHSNAPLESPSSPRSDFSRNSEESVIIVGDTFSAPVNLQFSMDSSPHVRDAGAFDRYSRAVNQPLSTSQSWRRDDASPSLTSTPPLNPRRPLPSPPLPRLGSPFFPQSPRNPALHIVSPSISPTTRPKAPPTGPRPLERPAEWVSGAKASRWRKKKNKEEILSMSGGGGGEFGLSPTRLDDPAIVDWGRRQSNPQLFPDHNLNPLVTSFRPTNESIIRARSFPGVSTSEQPITLQPNFQRPHSNDGYPTNPLHAPSMGAIQAETLASIEQDIHHLRQWSSLFQMQSFAFPEYQEYQDHSQSQPNMQQQQRLLHQNQYQHQPPYQHQVNMLPSREPFGNMHAFPSTTFAAPRFVPHGPNQRPPAYGQGHRSQPMDPGHSSLPQLQFSGNSGSSDSSTSTPVSILADLPLDALTHALTEIQLPETHLSTSIRYNPASNRNDREPLLRGAMGSSGTSKDGYNEHNSGLERQRNVLGPRHGVPNSRNKAPGSTLTPPIPLKSVAIGRTLSARGKTSLTPVTERSEISTPNASAANSFTSVSNGKTKRPKRQRRTKGRAAGTAKGANEKSQAG